MVDAAAAITLGCRMWSDSHGTGRAECRSCSESRRASSSSQDERAGQQEREEAAQQLLGAAARPDGLHHPPDGLAQGHLGQRGHAARRLFCGDGADTHRLRRGGRGVDVVARGGDDDRIHDRRVPLLPHGLFGPRRVGHRTRQGPQKLPQVLVLDRCMHTQSDSNPTLWAATAGLLFLPLAHPLCSSFPYCVDRRRPPSRSI